MRHEKPARRSGQSCMRSGGSSESRKCDEADRLDRRGPVQLYEIASIIDALNAA